MDRLVEGGAPAVVVDPTQRRRRQHAEGAGEHRRLVRQHVAEQVVGDDDVELSGLADQLHRAVVGVHVAERDPRELLVVDALHLLAPENAAFHHVGLVHRAHPPRAFLRQFEGDAGDAANFVGGVDLGVDPAAAAVGQGFDPARLAEVNAAGELADDHDVEALDHVELQAGGVGEGVEHHRRAQIGEQRHVLA